MIFFYLLLFRILMCHSHLDVHVLCGHLQEYGAKCFPHECKWASFEWEPHPQRPQRANAWDVQKRLYHESKLWTVDQLWRRRVLAKYCAIGSHNTSIVDLLLVTCQRVPMCLNTAALYPNADIVIRHGLLKYEHEKKTFLQKPLPRFCSFAFPCTWMVQPHSLS